MQTSLWRWLPLAVLVVTALPAIGQDDEAPRTIRIKKESDLVKAQFDNTEMRLFVVDRFGNPRDNMIVSYTLWVKGKKRGADPFKGSSNALTPEMLKFLGKQKEAVKIFFTGIIAIDENDRQVQLPDVIDVWFPRSPRSW